MFDILVYLYETYYRPDACPEPLALARKLSAVGFDDEEISEALVWLTDLTAMAGAPQTLTAESTGTRFYVEEERDVLGTAAIGFIQFLESAKVLSALQREIVIERALALDQSPVGLGKLKVIVLMLLWSQGKEPDALMFDDLFGADDEQAPRLLH
ncbi:Smg protein [Oxalobacteraceae bacterium GrIS 1.11]